jgi:hypothetical protein
MIENGKVSSAGGDEARKKGDQFWKHSEQKLLKTHVVKMSDFDLPEKLLIIKAVKNFLKVC